MDIDESQTNHSHLGDGLYASMDSMGQIWLKAERPISVEELDKGMAKQREFRSMFPSDPNVAIITHAVALEPRVIDALLDYAKRHGVIR